MPAGLEVYDASGNLIFEATGRTARLIDVVSMARYVSGSPVVRSYPGVAGSLFQAELVGNELCYRGVGNSGEVHPSASISGTTITWTWDASGVASPQYRGGTWIVGAYDG